MVHLLCLAAVHALQCVNITHTETQISTQAAKSIILNQKCNLAERLGHHLLTSSNVGSTYWINVRRMVEKWDLYSRETKLLMIDWTFLCADLCSAVKRWVIHHPVLHRVGLSVETAKKMRPSPPASSSTTTSSTMSLLLGRTHIK